MEHESAWTAEERKKEEVYEYLDSTMQKAEGNAVDKKKEYMRGAYEEQDAHFIAGDRTKALDDLNEIRNLYNVIYENPYFAHVVLTDSDGEKEDYFLTSSPDIDSVVLIGNTAQIIPFKGIKRDAKRPLIDKVADCYYDSGKTEFYQNDEKYTVELKRRVAIRQRALNAVLTLYPVFETDTIDGADNMLLSKLDENRKNAELRNIIETLQYKQMTIIRKSEKESFVLQGCAGSGKTQCLFHRLFYLSNIIGGDDWSNVLLITPTQLIRNYATSLVKQFHLEEVDNKSLAMLYREILIKSDLRIKERNYYYKNSEEGLPDEYLSYVYSADMQRKIDDAIEYAVQDYIEESYRLIETEEINKTAPYDIRISMLLDLLTGELTAYEANENRISNDEAFIEHRDKREKLRIQIQKKKGQLKKLINKRDDLLEKKSEQAIQEQKDKNSNDEKINRMNTRISKLEQEIADDEFEFAENVQWIKDNYPEIYIKGRKQYRSLLRYRISIMKRIESKIFDHAIWKVLKEVKEQYEIQTAYCEEESKVNTRILYKSDLIYYLRVFVLMNSAYIDKEIKYVCIDEGQDLFKMDYSMLKTLYPNIILNVFGDTEQELHESCGVTDWANDTGISEVLRLDTNYRNTATIVDFCNTRFDCKMRYIGKVREQDSP